MASIKPGTASWSSRTEDLAVSTETIRPLIEKVLRSPEDAVVGEAAGLLLQPAQRRTAMAVAAIRAER